MGATKNMVRGTFFAAIYVVTTLIIPLLTFSYVNTLNVQGINFQLEQKTYNDIIFWISAFGLLISGTAFFTFSSPSQSIRRGVMSLIQLLLNCLYIWSYKFSGATELAFELTEFGFMTLNLSQMVMLFLGIYFLSILLKIYDVIDFTVNREKIRENRWKDNIEEGNKK
ncbi:MAG: hypothetical protein ACOC44_05955 [Promethearchaeia archaeon]